MQLLYALIVSAALALLAKFLASHANGIHAARWSSPIISLGKGALLKGVLALFAVQFQVPDWIIDMLADTFSVRPQAAFALAFVMSFDLLSGIYASWWRKTEELDRIAKPADFLSSRRLRDSIIKVGEYIAILMLFTVAANVWDVEFGWAKRWSFMMVFLTEAWSTRENFQHVPVRTMFDRVKTLYNKKNPNAKIEDPEPKGRKADKATRRTTDHMDDPSPE
jgi:hypothetical protein